MRWSRLFATVLVSIISVLTAVAQPLETRTVLGRTVQIKPKTWDPGYPAGAAWVDFDNDGEMDYCRVGGDAPSREAIECTLFKNSIQDTTIETLADWGDDAGRLWIDVNHDGRIDYCRIVVSPNAHYECLLQTKKGLWGKNERHDELNDRIPYRLTGGGKTIACTEPPDSSHRRLVCDIRVDGHPGGRFRGFPDIVRLRNGHLFIVFYDGTGHTTKTIFDDKGQPIKGVGGQILGIRSNDNGASWSQPFNVADTPLDDRDPSVAQLPNGELLCNFFTRDEDQHYSIYVTRSRDEGSSWSPPQKLVPPNDFPNSNIATSSPVRPIHGLVASALCNGQSAGLVMPAYIEDDRNREMTSFIVASCDNGRTWSRWSIISPRAAVVAVNEYRFNEADVLQTTDSTLYAVMRTKPEEQGFWAKYSVGADGGSWSTPEGLGFPAQAPYLFRTSSGLVLLDSYGAINGQEAWSMRVGSIDDDTGTIGWGGSFYLGGYHCEERGPGGSDHRTWGYGSIAEIEPNVFLDVSYRESIRCRASGCPVTAYPNLCDLGDFGDVYLKKLILHPSASPDVKSLPLP
jgi:hypothetical protein